GVARTAGSLLGISHDCTTTVHCKSSGALTMSLLQEAKTSTQTKSKRLCWSLTTSTQPVSSAVRVTHGARKSAPSSWPGAAPRPPFSKNAEQTCWSASRTSRSPRRGQSLTTSPSAQRARSAAPRQGAVGLLFAVGSKRRETEPVIAHDRLVLAAA